MACMDYTFSLTARTTWSTVQCGRVRGLTVKEMWRRRRPRHGRSSCRRRPLPRLHYH